MGSISNALTVKQQLHACLNEIDILVKGVLGHFMNTKAPIDFEKVNETINKIFELENKINSILKIDLVKLVELKHKKEKLEEEYQNLDNLVNQYFILLKKSEEILATSIFNAQQKLKLIEKANKSLHTPENFVKFAHNISAHNSISAPQTWTMGDQQRPFPQDYEMRQGLLANMTNTQKLDGSNSILLSKLETNKSTNIATAQGMNMPKDSALSNDNHVEMKTEQASVENMLLDFSELAPNPSPPQVIPTTRGAHLSESSTSSENEAEGLFFNFDDN